jgi:hypothetical protein
MTPPNRSREQIQLIEHCETSGGSLTLEVATDMPFMDLSV